MGGLFRGGGGGGRRGARYPLSPSSSAAQSTKGGLTIHTEGEVDTNKEERERKPKEL